MKKISLKAFLNKRWIRVTAFQGHVFGGMLIFFPNHAIEVLLKAMSCIVPLYIRSYFSQLFKMSKVVSKKRTRSGTTDILVGEPCQLSENVLPTVLDIGRALLYHQLEMTAKFNTTIGSPINVKFNLFRDIVAEKIIFLWQKASIPHIRIERVKVRLNEIWTKWNSCKKRNNSSELLKL